MIEKMIGWYIITIFWCMFNVNDCFVTISASDSLAWANQYEQELGCQLTYKNLSFAFKARNSFPLPGKKTRTEILNICSMFPTCRHS